VHAPLIYDTAPSPALAYATTLALTLAVEDDSLRQQLARNITYFRTALAQLNIRTRPATTAIQPLLTGAGDIALRVAAGLRDKGLYVRAIRPPTVPRVRRVSGSASARHTNRLRSIGSSKASTRIASGSSPLLSRTESPAVQLSWRAVRRAFNRAASTFDEYAVLHREVAQRLHDRLQYMQTAPAWIIDLGAGTGFGGATAGGPLSSCADRLA